MSTRAIPRSDSDKPVRSEARLRGGQEACGRYAIYVDDSAPESESAAHAPAESRTRRVERRTHSGVTLKRPAQAPPPPKATTIISAELLASLRRDARAEDGPMSEDLRVTRLRLPRTPATKTLESLDAAVAQRVVDARRSPSGE